MNSIIIRNVRRNAVAISKTSEKSRNFNTTSVRRGAHGHDDHAHHDHKVLTDLLPNNLFKIYNTEIRCGKKFHLRKDQPLL